MPPANPSPPRDFEAVLAHRGVIWQVALQVARAFPLKYLDRDDLFQAGLEAASRAIPRHDPTKGAITTIVTSYAKWAMLDLVKTTTTLRIPRGAFDTRAAGYELATRAALGYEHALDVPERVASDPSAAACLREELHELQLAIAKLPPRLRRVLRGRFFEGLTLQELGEELGVSRERIRQLEGKALERLTQNLARLPRAVSA